MPLYEYECKQCHQRLEKIQSFSAPPEKICPKCGGELERVICAPAIQFKGAGWYVNDYAKSGAKKAPANSVESKGENVSASSAESKGENTGSAKSSGDSSAGSADQGSSSSSSSTSESSSDSSSKPASSTSGS
ncbi:MAG: FmdB family zinc ribbon protein [Acidobacteriaceae bacterium]